MTHLPLDQQPDMSDGREPVNTETRIRKREGYTMEHLAIETNLRRLIVVEPHQRTASTWLDVRDLGENKAEISCLLTRSEARQIGRALLGDAPRDIENERLRVFLARSFECEPVTIEVGRNIMLKCGEGEENWVLQRRPYPYAEICRGPLSACLDAAEKLLTPEPEPEPEPVETEAEAEAWIISECSRNDRAYPVVMGFPEHTNDKCHVPRFARWESGWLFWRPNRHGAENVFDRTATTAKAAYLEWRASDDDANRAQRDAARGLQRR